MTIAVAVVPGDARSRYAELLKALEEAYPVQFVALEGQDAVADPDAVLVLEGGRVPERLHVPSLVLEAPSQEHGRREPFAVEMSRSALLDRALVGQTLSEHASLSPVGVDIGREHDVLANVDGKPVWSCSALGGGVFRESASVSLTELADSDYLRDHLSAGRFWSLLPLAQFLKRLTFAHVKRAGPLAACLIIDDPNVHLPSYGYVHFSELGKDARERGYHVSVATIPLDLMLPGRRGLGAFREYEPELSLVVHGNDHIRHELEQCRTGDDADRIVGTADSRVRRFEERASVTIERVMCPPHGRCGPEVVAALFRWSYEGLAAAHPFPWDGFTGQRDWRLAGWLPAQLAGGGLPVLPRHPLGGSLDDLVFRAFLGQPLIVYCHHTDFRDGFGSIHAAVSRVAELGDVRWLSLASIARTNALLHVDPAATTVTLYSRDLRIPRPEADSLRIAIPRIFGSGETVRVEIDGGPLDIELDDGRQDSILVPGPFDGDELRIRLDVQTPLPAVGRRDSRPKAWPLARRAMTEARDRVLPLARRRTT